jgi:hypothetical protein
MILIEGLVYAYEIINQINLPIVSRHNINEVPWNDYFRLAFYDAPSTRILTMTHAHLLSVPGPRLLRNPTPIVEEKDIYDFREVEKSVEVTQSADQ